MGNVLSYELVGATGKRFLPTTTGPSALKVNATTVPWYEYSICVYVHATDATLKNDY